MTHWDLIVERFTREYERSVGDVEDMRCNNAIDVRLTSPGRKKITGQLSSMGGTCWRMTAQDSQC
jgi:hypothetical protein